MMQSYALSLSLPLSLSLSLSHCLFFSLQEGLAKNPNLEHAQLRFLLGTNKHKNDAGIKQKLLDEIKANGKTCKESP